MKLPKLDDPETTLVVVGEEPPPSSRIFPSLPGRLQQRWSYLACLSVRKGRGETSVPVIFSHDWIDDESSPPQMRPPQLEW